MQSGGLPLELSVVIPWVFSQYRASTKKILFCTTGIGLLYHVTIETPQSPILHIMGNLIFFLVNPQNVSY